MSESISSLGLDVLIAQFLDFYRMLLGVRAVKSGGGHRFRLGSTVNIFVQAYVCCSRMFVWLSDLLLFFFSGRRCGPMVPLNMRRYDVMTTQPQNPSGTQLVVSSCGR